KIIISLVGKVKGCKTESIKGTLLLAENSRIRIDGVSGERVDLEERKRVAAEEQARQTAAMAATDAERQKRLEAAETQMRKKEDADYARIKAARATKEAQERAKLRAACRTIYKNTSDKKVADLLVKEEQQVRACQMLGLYPPR